jgi:hypothetical protein
LKRRSADFQKRRHSDAQPGHGGTMTRTRRGRGILLGALVGFDRNGFGDRAV